MAKAAMKSVSVTTAQQKNNFDPFQVWQRHRSQNNELAKASIGCDYDFEDRSCLLRELYLSYFFEDATVGDALMELEDAFAHMDNIEATYGGDTPLVDAVRDMAKRVEAEVETRDKKETTKIERKMGKGWSLPSKQADAVLQVVAKNPKVQPATIVRFLAQKGTKVSINLVQKLRMNGQKSPKKG